MTKNIQLTHSEHVNKKRLFPLSVIANDMSSPLNVGSLFRLCDALGIEKLYLCGDTPVPPNTKINKTSRSTEKHVDYEYHVNAETLVTSLKASENFIVSLEISSSSTAIEAAEFQEKIHHSKSVCLIVGAEKTGVSESLLSLSALTVHIPMYGNNSSMNVVTAASIACYKIITGIQTAQQPS